jgi:phospholipase C
MNQPQTLGTQRKAMNSQLRHIVIIVKENHTFDNYFGTFPGANGAALAQRTADAFPEFDGQPFRFGSRVPCLALSPYARPAHISHQENSHVSLVRFCETTFGLGPLNQRDAASNGMSDCFDFAQQPLAPPVSAGTGTGP